MSTVEAFERVTLEIATKRRHAATIRERLYAPRAKGRPRLAQSYVAHGESQAEQFEADATALETVLSLAHRTVQS